MDLAQINNVVMRSELAEQPAIQRILNAGDGTIHLTGVLSDGGVHSHIDHMI